VVSHVVSTRFRVAPEGQTRRFGGELVVLDLTSGEYFALDPIGARIWDELAAGGSVGDVIEKMAPEYDVPPQIFRADLWALLDELVRRNLLVAVT
jgi:hypothetical protein